MIISRETDYAIRMLRELADGERHGVAAMCETEYIPKQFAYKILEKLQKADIVRCTRGRNGGCELTADLHEVTALDVLEVVDNNCCVNQCLDPTYSCPWKYSHNGDCKVHRKLGDLQETLNNTLRSMDLYSLIFE